MADNHQSLHKIYVPPAYMTQAGQTYIGARAPESTKKPTDPKNERYQQIRHSIQSSPTGIKNLTDLRVSYIADAKTKREERKQAVTYRNYRNIVKQSKE